MSRPRLNLLFGAVPAVLWLAASGLAYLAGLRFQIVGSVLQLLDRDELLAQPWTALALLHGQPPGLNALFALVLHVAGWLGLRPETVAATLFAALGLTSALILFRLARAVSGSVAAATLAVAVALADPGFHFFSSVFFYTFPLYALLLASLLCLERWLTGGDDRWLFALAAVLGAAVLTRSLYHPLWAMAALALAVTARARLGGSLRVRRVAAAAALLVALSVLWPIKNLAVFGVPVHSSWTGFNLARGTPLRFPELSRFLDRGEIDPALADEWAAAGHPDWIARSPLLVASDKPRGGRNWNHYVILLTREDLVRRALSWRLAEPAAWAELSANHYLMWARPTWVDSYWGTPRGPDSTIWRAWCRAHAAIAFADLRPLLEAAFPGVGLHRRARVWGGPVPYTAFGLILLPAILAGAAWRWRRRRDERDPTDWVVALAALHLAWLLVVPCLTDGLEGNRMRLPASPALLLLALYALRGGGSRRRDVRPSPAPSTSGSTRRTAADQAIERYAPPAKARMTRIERGRSASSSVRRPRRR